MLVGVVLDEIVEQVEVSEQEILHFPRGLVGFDGLTRYALLPLERPLFLLQALEDPHVGFVLLDPFLLDPCYRVELSEEDRTQLRLGEGQRPVLLVIATLGPEGHPRTANLRAPIVVNPATLAGTQVILMESHYLIRQPIFVLSDGALALERPGKGPGQRARFRADRSPCVFGSG